MKKIAIVICGNLIDRKGLVNAELSRIKYLRDISNYKIDVFAIQICESRLIRLLRGNKQQSIQKTLTLDDINIKLLRYNISFINYVFYKLKLMPIVNKVWIDRYLCLFNSYDLISAHSTECGELAMKINKRYRVPYCVTWHGSDIHTFPFHNRYIKQKTIRIIENAYTNFFVSDNLKEVSDTLIAKCNKDLLYNGVGEMFKQYSNFLRNELREKLEVFNKKVIAFVGGLIGIKNILLLPEIFRSVSDKYGKDLEFWIIGDGKLRTSLVELLSKYDITNYKLWGNQPVEKMPEFMNVIDVLVLPSKNEGLPLVTIEALSCGANVVGSNVGGISEAIGEENVFDLDENFVDNISNRIVEMLKGNIEQKLSNKFNWQETAKKENEIYNQILY